MIELEKQILPDKLSKLLIKAKSFAFMKIFMTESSTPKKFHKLRHYDLELQGATAISSWMKKKLQQVYLRHFLAIKDHNQYEPTSFHSVESIKNFKPQSQPPSMQMLQFKDTQKKKNDKNDRSRCLTDRQTSQQQQRSQSHQTNMNVHLSRGTYKSEFGSSQQSQLPRKSKLQNLLQKVREVNMQSRISKENHIKINNYQPSYQKSRIVSSENYFPHHYHGSISRENGSHEKNVRLTNQMSFCSYAPQQRQPYSSNLVSRSIKEHYPPSCRKPVSMNVTQQPSFQNGNSRFLKKLERSQKRSIIISKIQQLQNSLFAEYSKPEQYFYNNQDVFIHQNREMYQIPQNYSQGYLNLRSNLPTRSVVDMVRK